MVLYLDRIHYLNRRGKSNSDVVRPAVLLLVGDHQVFVAIGFAETVAR